MDFELWKNSETWTLGGMLASILLGLTYLPRLLLGKRWSFRLEGQAPQRAPQSNLTVRDWKDIRDLMEPMGTRIVEMQQHQKEQHRTIDRLAVDQGEMLRTLGILNATLERTNELMLIAFTNQKVKAKAKLPAGQERRKDYL